MMFMRVEQFNSLGLNVRIGESPTENRLVTREWVERPGLLKVADLNGVAWAKMWDEVHRIGDAYISVPTVRLYEGPLPDWAKE